MTTQKIPSVVACLVALAGLSPWIAAEEINFNRDVRPLLSDRCFSCHGPDEEGRKSDLRLDVPDGEYGAVTRDGDESVIVPGDVEASELWNRITTTDDDIAMPPAHAHKPAWSSAERDLIKKWIASGAAYDDFWAFVPVKEPVVTKGEPTAEVQAIDHFVRQRLTHHRLTSATLASKRTLIRRVMLDLTGLPPSPNEIREFLDDESPDAYEELVDRLLTSAHYGEHMARYWLDLVRFADTNGMHKDFYRNFVAYRDWVIRAFNENLGYDDFVRYQLAGDLYDQPTHDQLVATGFNRLHLIIDKGTALPEESHFKNVVDRVSAFGTVFLGLTVQCAQCHDHKYDPISQRDYYSLFAFFNNVDAAPETNFRPPNGLQEPYISMPTPEQVKELAEFDAKILAATEEISIAKTELEEAQARKGEKTCESDQASVDGLVAKLKAADEARSAIERERRQYSTNVVTNAMVMKERADVRPTFVMYRGQYDAPLEDQPVERATPKFLPKMEPRGDVASRLDLANWLTDPQHPLTARVAVNRLWQQFFGVGLVKTSEDLGAQGQVPSHPELLDYLAWSFVESGWDIKALVKEIVLSETYRQASHATTEQFRSDPENRLLARGPRYRLDAEVLRDQILASSGLLSKTMYGPSVKPPQPDGLWKSVSMTNEVYRADQGESIYRRSLYTYWKRAMPPPQMTILNAPTRDACVARRERTNTPSQALLLLNEPAYLGAARHLAGQVLRQSGSDEEKLVFSYEVITGKIPDEQELQFLKQLLMDTFEKYSHTPSLADEVCEGLALDKVEDRKQVATWTVVLNTLYNLDITKNKD